MSAPRCALRALRGAAAAAALALALLAGLAACNRLPDETWLRIISIQDESGNAVTSLAVDVSDEATTDSVNVEMQNQTSTVGVGGGGVGILVRRVRVETSAGGVAFPVLDHPATLYLPPGAESGATLSVAVFPPSQKKWVRDIVYIPDGGMPGSARITLFAITDEGRELETSGGFALRLESGGGGGGGGNGTLPRVTVTASDPTAKESPVNTGELRISRSGSTVGSLVVRYTLDGTATLTGDYTVSSGSQVTIADGASSAVVTVTPVADGTAEGDETVELVLDENPTTYTVGTPGSATVTISD